MFDRIRGLRRPHKRHWQIVLIEFQNALLFSVSAANILDAIANGRLVRIPGSIDSFLPHEPRYFSAAIDELGFDTAADDCVASLHEFYARLSFARQLTQGYFGIPDGSRNSHDINSIAGAWHCAVAKALSSSHILFGLSSLSGSHLQRHRNAHATAIKLRSEPSRSILGDGTVVIPLWMESRVHQRLRRGSWVFIEATELRYQVFLNDISQGGVGLSSCSSLSTGMPIVVIFEDGRRIPAVVIWVHGERSGARFLASLDTDDPLLGLPASTDTGDGTGVTCNWSG